MDGVDANGFGKGCGNMMNSVDAFSKGCGDAKDGVDGMLALPSLPALPDLPSLPLPPLPALPSLPGLESVDANAFGKGPPLLALPSLPGLESADANACGKGCGKDSVDVNSGGKGWGVDGANANACSKGCGKDGVDAHLCGKGWGVDGAGVNACGKGCGMDGAAANSSGKGWGMDAASANACGKGWGVDGAGVSSCGKGWGMEGADSTAFSGKGDFSKGCGKPMDGGDFGKGWGKPMDGADFGKGWGKPMDGTDFGKGCGKMDGADAGKGWGKMEGADFGKGKDSGKFKGKDKGEVMAMVMAMKGKMGKEKGMGKDMGKEGGKGEGQPAWDYVPGKYCEEPGGKVGIEGLKDAVTRACEPHVHKEPQWSKDDMINRLAFIIFKNAAKWYKEDNRHKETGTAVQAQALLEEFAQKIMDALSKVMYDKPWFLEIYLSEAMALAAINIFKGGALFNRTVAPIIVTHIDESIFRWREEERHQRVMWDAIAAVGIKADYQKKANKHLQTSYEAAHVSAQYGASAATSPELGMVQDFVQAWISEFGMRAWDVLNNGIHVVSPDQQVAIVTMLFQYLCHPTHTCLPHDLVSQLNRPPPENWDFIATATILMFSKQ